jgi:hypothetical protein
MAEEQVTKQEQTVRLAPFQESYLEDIFKSAKDLTGSGTQMPYSAQQLAGLSPAQQQAITGAMGGVGAYQPYLQQGSAAIGQGIGAVGAGLDTMGNALTQLPGAQQQYQNQADAAGLATQQGQAGLGQAQGMTAGANYNFDPNSYQSYMDPYMNDVVQQQYQDIQRQGDIQKQQANAQAVGSGAFGGSRQGIQQAEMDRNILDQQARTGSQLRSTGFQQASNMAQQAAASQAQQQLQQANQYGQQAGAIGQLGQAGAQQMGQVGQGLGNLAQLTGQLGSTTGALGQTIGQLGTATAGIGQLGQQMGVQDINSLMGVGALGQQQAQKSLDITRANDLARQNLPYQQIGFMSDIFRGVPALQQTTATTTAPGASTTSQMLGLAQAGIGAYGMMNQGKYGRS